VFISCFGLATLQGVRPIIHQITKKRGRLLRLVPIKSNQNTFYGSV
jgi:hypothetical protein